MSTIIDAVAARLFRKKTLSNLEKLNIQYTRMVATLERFLLLTTLDPRDVKVILQERIQGSMFNFNIERAGVQVFTSQIEKHELTGSFLFKVYCLSTIQLRKNKTEEEELQKLLASYDGYTDRTLAALPSTGDWIN